MSKPKLGPWHPADVKPVHVGYYQRDWKSAWLNSMPDFWDGERWFVCNSNGSIATTQKANALRWRGLAEKPK